MRYIRYGDGSDELYNQKTDPNEWSNVAGKPENEKVKKELAKFFPSVNAEPIKQKANPEAEESQADR